MLFPQKQQLNKEISSNILFSLILKRITTLLMKQGKRTQAEKILENILLKISLKGYSPRKIFVLAINNVKPLIEVRNIRVKGKSFQVPIPLSKARQFSLAIKTILKNSSGKKNIENAVVDELINSSLNKSLSVKTTIGMYKLAARNRLFAHYRWF